MSDVTFSKHVGGSTELTLIAPIRRDLVEVGHMTLSHATRLRILFRVLFASAKSTAESATGAYRFPHALENLEVLHFVRYGLIDHDRKLLLCVAYDGGPESYLRDQIVGKAGPLLDAIFCHCEGYTGQHSSDKGYPAFARWVAENTEEVQYFYSGFPDRSVGDIRYLEEFEKIQREDRERSLAVRDRMLAEHRVGPRDYPDLGPDERRERFKKVLELASTLHELDGVFSPVRDEQLYLQRASALLTSELVRGEIPPDLQAQFEAPLKWVMEGLADLRKVLPSQMEVELDDATPGYEKETQGGILTGYPKATHGALLFLRMRDPDRARQFLVDFDPTSDAEAAESLLSRNIALTYQGLERLGVPEADPALLPAEFVQGMEERAGILGDVGRNHPDEWKLLDANWPLENPPSPGVPLSSVDVVVHLRIAAPDEEPHYRFTAEHPLIDAIEAIAEYPGMDLLSVQPLRRLSADGQVREHFGFADGLSQPHVDDRNRDANWAPLGEFLLGYDNWKKDQLPIPAGFENGSFLVVRKLRQNLAALAEFERESARRLPSSGGRPIAELLMGRWRDGSPLAVPEGGAWDGDFDYHDDPRGETTPHHSHVRRANPRQEDARTRILRRGMSYGPTRQEREGAAAGEPEEDSGLVFMAYNANIAQQFEVIQRWLVGNSPSGTYSGERDPFLAVPRPGEARWLRLLHGDEVVRVKLPDEPFVTLDWGVYLFVPSLPWLKGLGARLSAARPAVSRLASSSRPAASSAVEPELPDDSLLKRMKLHDAFQTKEEALDRWRTLLEDPGDENHAKAGRLWADVRQVGGVSRTHYGVLVGSFDPVSQVLYDEEHFSVREYWDRMDGSLGALHLGMDHAPRQSEGLDDERLEKLDERYRAAVHDTRYRDESSFVNPGLGRFGRDRAFVESVETLNQLVDGEDEIKLPGLTFRLVANLSAKWFGLPDGSNVLTTRVGTMGQDPDGDTPTCPGDFNAVARYVFWPNPTQRTKWLGIRRGNLLRDAAQSFLEQQGSHGNPHDFVRLLNAVYPNDVGLVRRLLLGSIHGFVAATAGNLVNIGGEWAETNTLQRLQRELSLHETWPRMGDDERFQRAQDVLEGPLLREMRERPVPDLLHRMAIKSTTLGSVRIEAGDRVVLSLRSAAADRPDRPEILFGGKYSENGSTSKHACSGRDMGMGVLLGAFSALLEGYEFDVQSRVRWKIAPRG